MELVSKQEYINEEKKMCNYYYTEWFENKQKMAYRPWMDYPVWLLI